MVEHNTQTDEKHLFCDRCSRELLDKVYVLTTGDCLCEECFEDSYTIQDVEEFLKGY